MSKWVDSLSKQEKELVQVISGQLNLGRADQYSSLTDFLDAVYSRIIDSRSVIYQLKRLFG